MRTLQMIQNTTNENETNGSLQTTNEFLSQKLLLGQIHWRIPKNVRQFKA
jgi:hypothetical protein